MSPESNYVLLIDGGGGLVHILCQFRMDRADILSPANALLRLWNGGLAYWMSELPPTGALQVFTVTFLPSLRRRLDWNYGRDEYSFYFARP